MQSSSGKYFNRELSWLEFNQRVLEEAQDPTSPLLERLKFLAITASNLDEFFMVRVGGLLDLAERGGGGVDPAGLTPRQQLQAISTRTMQMSSEQYACHSQELEPALAAAGVKRLAPKSLTPRQREWLEERFDQEIFPVLTPLAVEHENDFPLLQNLVLHLAVRLEGPPEAPECWRFALLSLGRALRRLLTLKSQGGYEYVLLEDVARLFVDRFFPGVRVLECAPFRITRNADMGVREDLAADLLVGMEALLAARRDSDCVRLEICASASPELTAHLRARLDVGAEQVYTVPGPLDLSAFFQLTDIPGFDHLRNAPWPPQPSPQVDRTRGVFDVVAEKDVLLTHPYESFEPVLRLVEEAANDPQVLAIKQVLYRTSRNSPIVAALLRAAEKGKHVTALVELKARFDEARNIEWAKNLERAGVQVVYGVKRLKTHAKVCLVVRRETTGLRRYVHFGTGNYNELTARLYTDISLLTCHEEFGADAASFFNAVTGYSQPQAYRKIEAAPTGMRSRLLELIEGETNRKRQGQHAEIVAKVNSLVDPQIIDALYEASQAGVRVRLNVRGICCLRPGVPDLSENISVVSIVDRYLEHARILYFLHGGDELLFISSADWMPRNLDKRLELLVPVESPPLHRKLRGVLEACFQDNVKGRRLLPSGQYERVAPNPGQPRRRCQEILYETACEEVKEAAQAKFTVFEPHQRPQEE